MLGKSAQKKAGDSAGFEPTETKKQQKNGEIMKALKKDLTASSCGEQIKSAIPCTFRAHASGVKSAATVHYVDANGIDKTYFALTTAIDPLFGMADQYDDDVITACLLTAGYRSGRDLTALENAVKTAESAAAPFEKRAEELNKQAAACGDDDTAKHDSLMKELDKNGPALAAARDAVAKARAALEQELTDDIREWLSAFEKRAAMLTAVSEWLYNNAADRFAAIAQTADEAVRERAKDFAGRMLACVDHIAQDEEFPLNQKGRRCSCADNVENDIIKAIKRPFNGGVGYKHLATGGLRYCNVPRKSGSEVTIEKVTD